MKKSVRFPRLAFLLCGSLAAAAACSGGHSLVPNAAGPAFERHGKASCIAGYSGANAWPIQIVDKSGLKPAKGYPAIYVTYGSPPQYMNASGALVAMPTAPATVPPMPAAQLCKPATGKPTSGFNLNPAGSGRLYIAYGPLTLNSANEDPSGNVDTPGGTNYGTIFDWYEFNAGTTFFTSNVQAYIYGLPLQLLAEDSNGRYYSGGFNNNYLKLIKTYETAPKPWNALVLKKDGKPLRVLTPGAATSFPNVFSSFVTTLANFYSNQYSSNAGGIVYAPMALTVPGSANTQYGTCLPPPTPSPGNGYITACPLYNVTHDSNGFEFMLEAQGAPALPSGISFPAKVTIPDSAINNSLTFGNAPPVSLPGVPAFPTPQQTWAPGPWNAYLNGAVEFYIYKYLGNDLDRGVAMLAPAKGATVAHPVVPGCMKFSNSPPCIGKNYYPATGGNVFDTYAQILHSYAVDPYAASKYPWPAIEPGGAYGSAYEDTWSQSSTVTLPAAAGPTIQYIKICIHPMIANPPGGDCF